MQATSLSDDAIKARVLNLVYEADGIRLVAGYSHLSAVHRTTGVGIFVIDGDFTRDVFREALAEAKAAGARTPRMYVYGRRELYSGPAISFTKLEEIGL